MIVNYGSGWHGWDLYDEVYRIGALYDSRLIYKSNLVRSIGPKMCTYNDCELLPLSTEHMQYMKKRVMHSLDMYCIVARDDTYEGHMLTMDEVKSVRRMGERIMEESSPANSLGLMRAVAYRGLVYIPLREDEGQRTRILLQCMHDIFRVYVTGFTDACCTMNGGASIIHPEMNVLQQFTCIKTAVSKYPRLSLWVDKCDNHWHDALAEISNMKNTVGVGNGGLRGIVWYMTT